MTVSGAPERIWLVYGDVDDDTEHADCREVAWCEDAQFDHDVPYVRGDIADARLEEVERLRTALTAISEHAAVSDPDREPMSEEYILEVIAAAALGEE